MSSLENSETSAQNSRQEQFYSRIIPRMLRVMVIAGVLLLWPAYRFYGWFGMAGFAAGGAVSYINFRVLISGVEGLLDRIVNRQSRERGRKIVVRFLLRYGLVAIVAYAIFRGSAQAFKGFLWGLCVPVAAMMVEAVVETCIAFRE